MKQRFVHFSIALCTVLAAAFTLTSCREDTIIKSSLTPAVDNIHTFGIGPDFDNGKYDTITMHTQTVYDDSFVTSTRSSLYPVYHALGSAADPFAGKTSAGIFMQVVPTVTGFKFPSDQILDSMVLVLPYSGFTWGDTMSTVPQTVKAYMIKESFSKDSAFYSFSNLGVDAKPIGTATFHTGFTTINSGSIKDSVWVSGKKRAPHLRIRLDTTVLSSAFRSALSQDDSFSGFTNTFRGFYIAPDTTIPGTALPYFRLSGSLDFYAAASMIAYTHNTTKDSSFLFPYNLAQAAHFNRITRNYFNPISDAGKWLQSTSPDDSIIVMQNGPGTVIDVVLPFIQSLPKNVLINKAELVFTKVPSTADERFFGPARILPFGVNSSGGIYTIADRYAGSDAGSQYALDFIDGTPHTVVKGGTAVIQYRVNIPREVQKTIVQGSNGLHLRIGGTINFPAAYRLVLAGSGATDAIYKPSVNIIYSKQ